MGDGLADALRSELSCSTHVASALAPLVREHLGQLGGNSEDSDADIVVRLRDPRAFGALAEVVVGHTGAGAPLRLAVVEHVFDLLPLPRSEGDVIEVEARAPPRLLALAAFLVESDNLSVLHVMHLVYAVFLDRSLIGNVSRPTRSALYRSILRHADVNENLRILYAALHLAAVAESEATAEFRRTLGSAVLSATLRRSLASMAAANDGGRTMLTGLAQREGLLPGDLPDVQAPAILATIPRLPERLAAAGRTYLERTRHE